MLRTPLKGLAVLAVVGAVLGAQQAEAGWRHHGSWGSCGSSGGSWGSWGGGSWGSSGGYYSSWGYGSWGSSGGSWGSSGGSWGSSGGSWGSSGGYGTVTPATPAAPAAPMPSNQPAPQGTPPAPSEAAPAPAPGSSTYHPTYGPMRTSALLSVRVPADAKVFVNDRPTTSTGSDREYVSRDLQAGARYSYDIRAEFVRDGQTVTENRSVQLIAGQTANLDFTATAAKTAEAETRTTLTVHLPADAKLFLADHETQATGTVREFSTSRLANGSEWASYAIRAVVERDGKPEVREQTVTLKAGESRDITLSFGAEAGERVADSSAR